MTCTMVDREYKNTGWDKVCFTAPSTCPSSSASVNISVKSTGDGIDRLVTVAPHNCEVIRFITPFDSELSQTVQLTEPIASVATSYSDICSVFTTFFYSGNPNGGYYLKITYDGQGKPGYSCVPAWYMEFIDNSTTEVSADIGGHFISHFVLNMTGHRGEEGSGVNRRWQLILDGNVVWDQTFPDWRWYPGKGYVEPIVVSVNRRVNRAVLKCLNCGHVWIASGWAAVPGGAGGVGIQPVNILPAALVGLVAGIIAGVSQKK
ncbi:MAG: hypothetical protein JZD41_03625 [Thermoproteus sp.]|nr:hypothetical protein [Thermoproteus sp.]